MEFTGVSLSDLEKPALYLKSVIDAIHYPVVLLTGEMGAGKTTFTGVFVNLFTTEKYVNSPTFNLYNVYKIDGKEIYHFDLYRLRELEDLETIGVEEIWGKRGICIIEWWQIGADYLPEDCIEVEIKWNEPETRDIIIHEKKMIR